MTHDKVFFKTHQTYECTSLVDFYVPIIISKQFFCGKLSFDGTNAKQHCLYLCSSIFKCKSFVSSLTLCMHCKYHSIETYYIEYSFMNIFFGFDEHAAIDVYLKR